MKYVSKELARAPWEDILVHYGCVGSNGEKLGEAAVFEHIIKEKHNIPPKEKRQIVEDYKHFKPRGHRAIPQGLGTDIYELNRMVDQLKSIYQEMDIYYMPLVKTYEQYIHAEILQLNTSPLTKYLTEGK
jgi:hypothetical protein